MLVELSAPLRAAAQEVRAAAAQGAAEASTTPGPRRGSNSYESRRQPVIQSDPRQNSIIIRDSPERLPIYEKLIEVLDQPTALIEIEALIVDVNNTKVDELGLDWLAQNSNRAAIGFGTPQIENDRSTLQVTRNVNPQ